MDKFSLNRRATRPEIWGSDRDLDISAQQYWNPESKMFLDPELQDLNFAGNEFKSIWDDDLLSSTPHSWRLPDSVSLGTNEFDRKHSTTTTSSYTDSESNTVSLSDIDWNSMIDDQAIPAQDNAVQDQKESEYGEDWAWMTSSPSSMSTPESKLDISEDQVEGSRTDIRSNQKSTKFLPAVARKERGLRDPKESHNAIERKYRANINLKLSELGQWLLDHPSSSDIGYGTPLRKITKFTTIAAAMDRLEYLSRCNKSLEDQRAAYKQQIAGLKRIVKAQRNQQRLARTVSGA